MAERLAVEGGPPVRPAMLPYGRQTVDDDDVRAVVEALRSDWLTTGPAVAAFEGAVADLVGAAHAVAVSSGTAALHAAMAAAGVGPGDEVVTSPITFVASANAALYVGAVPVFADVLPDTLAIDPAAVAAAMTPRTRAVVPVDYAGQPCEMDPIAEIARAHGATLVADAAHSLGGEYRGRRVGTLADMSVLSFHPVKALTTAEGGMVTTDRADLARSLRRFRNHGMETDFHERARQRQVYSPMEALGYNYRLTDLQCALGLAQLGKLKSLLSRRTALVERYEAALGRQPGLRLLRVLPHARPAWHIFPVLLELERLTVGRDAVLAALRAENIGATVHYVPAYWHPYYERLGYRRGLCPVAEDAFGRLLTLPLFPGMTDGDADDVVRAVAKVLGHYLR